MLQQEMQACRGTYQALQGCDTSPVGNTCSIASLSNNRLKGCKSDHISSARVDPTCVGKQKAIELEGVCTGTALQDDSGAHVSYLNRLCDAACVII
jgi:hypothetical protein